MWWHQRLLCTAQQRLVGSQWNIRLVGTSWTKLWMSSKCGTAYQCQMVATKLYRTCLTRLCARATCMACADMICILLFTLQPLGHCVVPCLDQHCRIDCCMQLPLLAGQPWLTQVQCTVIDTNSSITPASLFQSLLSGDICCPCQLRELYIIG